MHSACTYDKKRQKSSEGQEDMISDLPDFVIGRILSFLPSTKYAVLTSSLSQSWIYKWMFLTDLRFDYNHPSSSYLCQKRKTLFINFVYRVLLNLNTATIHTFSLDILHDFDSYHINQWISSVSNKRVKIIRVKLWRKFNLYPYPLFKCQSLEELKLQMLDLCILKFPTFVSLSSLIDLHLFGIAFTCYSSNESKELTLNFPLLREYYAANCTWTGVKSVTLEAPLLEVVSLAYPPFYPPPGHYESHTEIKFCASHLRKFSYRGNISSDIFVLDVADIGSANILMFSFEDTNVQETWIFIFKLLTVNAKCLNLCLRADWKYLLRTKHDLADIPAFGMLSALELNSVTREILLGLLLKSPSLETLVFQMVDFDEEPQNFSIVPDCFLSTLKVVNFEKFAGKERELCFAKFLMENARVLERISFCCSRELHGLEMEKVKEKLVLVKRSSSTVIVEYKYPPEEFAF